MIAETAGRAGGDAAAGTPGAWVPAAPEGDAFARVGAALRAVLAAAPEAWAPDADPSRFRNLVLDACGSDHRPLVELLLDVGQRHRLRLARHLADGESWEARRAPLVHHLVATRYLQPEVTRWLVDAWGAAYGLVDPRAVASPTVRHADAADAPRPHALADPRTSRAGAAAPPAPTWPVPPARGGGRPAAGAAPMSPAGRGTSPPVAGAPSWAGGTAAGRLGARPLFVKRRSAAPIPPPAPRTPLPAGAVRRIERVAFVLLAAAAVMSAIGVTVIHRGRMAIKRAEELADAEQVARRAAQVADAVMARPAETGGAGAVAAPPAGDVAMVERPATGGPPVGEGTPSPATDTSPGAASVTPSAPLSRATGVGGRYRVAQHVRSVTGFEHCEPVAAALRRDRWTDEVIVHAPGAAEFTIPARRIAGRLAADGAFSAGPQQGVTNGVRWQFQMVGRFGGVGFVGESRMLTEAILRWRRSQRCLIVAELTGVREGASR